MSKVVVVTGTRRETRRGVISRALSALNPKPGLVIMGDALGVDQEAFEWCMENGVLPARVYALWEWHKKHGKRTGDAGPQRNSGMAHMCKRLGGELCLAVPDEESKGTHDCARTCERLGLRVEWPK